jgi:hypothetical protein
MINFNKNSENVILIMYPTGGYGNFLYHLLTEYFDNTVKVKNNFQFSAAGNSHQTYKYTESFLLGSNYKNIQNFEYNYLVNDQKSYQQILLGKKFLVLCDTGNLMDSVKVLLQYFPNAKIIRCYAETFQEKLVTWNNCMEKSEVADLYPGSLHTKSGIATFTNTNIDDLTDQNAIDCLVNFFKNNFEPFGRFYSSPSKHPSVFNLPIKQFFNKDTLLQSINQCAKWMTQGVVNHSHLEATIDEFIQHQRSFDLLDQKAISNTIIGKAINIWEEQCLSQ